MKWAYPQPKNDTYSFARQKFIHSNLYHTVTVMDSTVTTYGAIVKCSRTHYGWHCETISGQKCTRLQDFAYTISKKFSGAWTPAEWGGDPLPYPPPAKRHPVLGSRHQFPLGSPAFSLFPFYQTTTALHPCCYVGNSAVNYRHFCSVRSTSRRYRDCKGRKTCAPQILELNRTEMPTFQWRRHEPVPSFRDHQLCRRSEADPADEFQPRSRRSTPPLVRHKIFDISALFLFVKYFQSSFLFNCEKKCFSISFFQK